MNDNPAYDLLVDALDCAERLTWCDPPTVLAEAINRAFEVIELPDWLPEFEQLIAAVTTPSAKADGFSDQPCGIPRALRPTVESRPGKDISSGVDGNPQCLGDPGRHPITKGS